MRRIAVIPAYEPEEKMIKLLREASAEGLELIVVDDGSGQEFLPVFRAAESYAHVISYSKNKGKGHALKEAFSYIRDTYKGEYTVVVMDCDGQHRVEDALALCEQAEEERSALIIGSRKQSRKSPLKSRLGNGITRKVFSMVAGSRIYDTQTGLRAFSDRLLPMLLEIWGERYEYEMNMLLVLSRRKIPIQELPIETIYFDNNTGTHFDTLKDSVRIYKEILKFSMSSFMSFLIDYLMFGILMILLGQGWTIAANIGARLVSATANFAINRRFVFGASETLRKSALKYAMLAGGILVCNTGVLYVMTDIWSVNPYVAKIMTEMVLFVVSWAVQRTFVFQRQEYEAAAQEIPHRSR